MFLRLILAVFVAILAYIAGAFGGGALIYLVSSNTHDISVEAAMTGAFVTGPLMGIVGFVVPLVWPRRRKKQAP